MPREDAEGKVVLDRSEFRHVPCSMHPPGIHRRGRIAADGLGMRGRAIFFSALPSHERFSARSRPRMSGELSDAFACVLLRLCARMHNAVANPVVEPWTENPFLARSCAGGAHSWPYQKEQVQQTGFRQILLGAVASDWRACHVRACRWFGRIRGVVCPSFVQYPRCGIALAVSHRFAQPECADRLVGGGRSN